MKHRIFLLLLFISPAFISLTGKDIELPPNRVVIFTQSALIESESEIALQSGTSVLNFIRLSHCILKESIRVEGDGSYKIINVQHQNDYLNEINKRHEIQQLIMQIDELDAKIEDEQTQIKIIDDKYEFLKSNREFTGKAQGINADQFGAMIDIYGKNIELLNLEKLKRERLISEYKKQTDKYTDQLNQLNGKTEMPSGTISITVVAGKTENAHIKISYLVNNVSWYPSYDIRYNGVAKPVSLTCKANIEQNSGVDWQNVTIVLSTAKTNLSAKIPDFSPWYLKFNYNNIDAALQGRAYGLVINDSGAPGASSVVRIRGIGSLSSTTPTYIVDGVPQADISYLNPDDIQNVEVLKDASAHAIYGSTGSNGVVNVITRKDKNISGVPMTITWKQETANEYEIESAQTLMSGNGLSTIQFKETELSADYEFQALPALSPNVFLIARVPEWYKADIADGEAHLYMENSYVGKTSLVKKQFTDTMDISFGVDNHIDIKREKIYGFSQSQIMGSNRKETRVYKITVRNNKSYGVTTQITDQIPVSTTKDIQVEPIDLSGGKLEKYTGRVEWNFELKPSETRELILKYEVKYPKEQQLSIN